MRIALFQSRTGIEPEANATALVAGVRDAAAGGAAMLFTPEMSGLLDRDQVLHGGPGHLRQSRDEASQGLRQAAHLVPRRKGEVVEERRPITGVHHFMIVTAVPGPGHSGAPRAPERSPCAR